ncbi:hypothetical protein, partial [Mesotoga sp. B105.6.4]|uniref:hypothetical protein n=1 Tax=Mesotoga sp. B105.6.4 TaxID=1582224 RepID=UPI001CA5D22E
HICCLRPVCKDSTSGTVVSRLLVRSLSLWPDHSLTILNMALSIDFSGSVSFPTAIQATGL